MKRKGFTLIELLAVLVVLAILALISIPITIRIINNAREESYKRSIESYGKAFEKVIAIDNIDSANNDYDLLSNLVSKVDSMYTGNRVSCDFSSTSNTDDNYSTLINGKLVLRGCTVNGNEQTYKYENNKVSLQKKYETYEIGKEFYFNGDEYNVISDGGVYQDYVVLLKYDPLTTEEIIDNGTDSEGINHINRYIEGEQGVPYNIIAHGNPFGGVAYYSSETCGYNGSDHLNDNACTSDYDQSDVKYIVDIWASNIFQHNELKEVNGYKSRLIKKEELEELGYGKFICWCNRPSGRVPQFLYQSNQGGYWYWTMSSFTERYSLYVGPDHIGYSSVYSSVNSFSGQGRPMEIRPVINVYKDKLPS